MSVPLDPTREEGRRLAVEELAKQVYEARRPGLVERFTTWLFDQLQKLPVPDGPGNAVVLGVVLVALVAVVATALWRVRGLAARRADRRAVAVLDDPRRTAADLRAAADAAAAAGRWDDAVLDRFRAVARELEERAVLDPQPGRTADEVAGQAAVLLPDLAAGLTGGARTFDDVAYGDRPGTPAADAALRALDDAVRRARPAALAR